MLASAAAPMLSGAARAAVMPVSMTGMGVTSYGSAVSDELARADAAERAGDHAEAQRLRDNYRYVAAGKAVAEVASQFILPQEKLLTGALTGSFSRRLGTGLAKAFAEGAAAETGSQLVDRVANGDDMDLSRILKSGVMEAAVGAPLVGVAALRSPDSANVTEGSPTEAPGNARTSTGDAGSTPAVGANFDQNAAALGGKITAALGPDGTVFGQLPPTDFEADLTTKHMAPEEAAEAVGFGRWIGQNFPARLQSYQQQFGNHISADNWRELHP